MALVIDDRWLRRQAIQIAAQLPESEKEALIVLGYAAELVSGFMEGRACGGKPDAGVVRPLR